MKGMKNQMIMAVLFAAVLLAGTGCTKDSGESAASAGDEETCPVCGEKLEPGTFGKEGCYRDSWGRYLTRQEAGRYFVSFSNSDDSGMPKLPEEERTSCPDCGAVLEPGTFGDEGCYRTKSGCYLTKDQYRRILLGCWDMDIDENTRAAIMGYDHPDYCVEEYPVMREGLFNPYYTPTLEDYVHNKPVSEKMTAEKIKEFAEDEIYGESHSSYGTNPKLYRIFYDKTADMWMAEYYSYQDSENTVRTSRTDYCQVFIDGTGVTRDIYCPGENVTDDKLVSNEKKPPVDEIGTFSYADVHKTEGFIHKGEAENVTMETLADYADEEVKNSVYASWIDGRHITKLAQLHGKNMYRVSYYWEEKPYQNIHVYLTPKGETVSMYVHEE